MITVANMQYISQPITSSLTSDSEERKISTFVSGDREKAAKTYCEPLWASLKNDSDTAERHENRQKYFATVLDCLKILNIAIKKWRPATTQKTGRYRKAK